MAATRSSSCCWLGWTGPPPATKPALIEGEPESGETRILETVLEAADIRGFRVLEAKDNDATSGAGASVVPLATSSGGRPVREC
jgi:hypothetical protein